MHKEKKKLYPQQTKKTNDPYCVELAVEIDTNSGSAKEICFLQAKRILLDPPWDIALENIIL